MNTATLQTEVNQWPAAAPCLYRRRVRPVLKYTLTGLAVVFTAVLVLTAAVWAATDKAAVESTPDALQNQKTELQNKITALQAQIKSFLQSEKPDVAKGLNVTVDQLKKRTETLQETLAFNNRQLIALRQQESLLQEKKQLDQDIQSGKAFELSKSPPYSLSFYDDYADKLTESIRNQETTAMALTVSQKSLESAKTREKEAGQQVRTIKEGEGKTKDPNQTLTYQWRLAQGQREEDLARAVLGYQETAYANIKLQLELAKSHSDILRKVLARIQANLFYDKKDLDKEIALIEERKNALQAETDGLLAKQHSYELKQINAQRRLDTAKGAAAITDAKAALTAAELWRQTMQGKLEQLESTIQLLTLQKKTWQQRYDLVRGKMPATELKLLQQDAAAQNERLQRSISLEQSRQTNLQLQIGNIEEKLAQESQNKELKKILMDQRQALMDLAQSTFNYLTVLNTTNQMHLRLMDGIDHLLKHQPLSETIQSYLPKLGSIWQFEIVVVDGQSVTVGKVIVALVILILGVIITGRLTSALQRRVLTRAHMSTSAVVITSKLLYYFFLLLVVLFAMHIVNIPLTAFTFLGGAIAIGVGFGAQKLISNFISGFIIMAEQPIRIGDLIQMGDELGWIEDIGVRSTRVRTYSNINILVPNSYFLENNITNWTHNDNVVRGQVTVGVAYGSPSRDVRRLLLQVAQEHGDVRKKPDPYVWFNDFGDNALIFDLYFWITVDENVGRQRVASDLRFMIDESFRQNGITIAFPQRDVHFDADIPFKVEIVPSAANAQPQGQPD